MIKMNNRLKLKPFLYSVVLTLLLPNLVFMLIAIWLGYNRPIINIDYLFSFLFLICKKPIIKSIGIILFILFFMLDLLLIVLQQFPTFHFKDVFYLLGFVFNGPKIYLFCSIIMLGILILESILIWKLSNKITFINYFSILIILGLANVAYYKITSPYDKDARFYTIQLLDTKFHSIQLLKSNTAYFITNKNNNSFNLLGGNYLEKVQYKHATAPWTQLAAKHKPLNKKIFLIIVESWGQPLNQDIQNDVLKNLTAQSHLFNYYQEGKFPFSGFTLDGELRELCQLHATTLNIYQIKIGFQNCLPNYFNRMGYLTEAIHGSNGDMYGRKAWWPRAGFKKVTFQDDLHMPAKCIPFSGICDWDIIPYIKQNFAKDKSQFIYWMTLTSHYQYYKHDIHNTRFNCSAYNIDKNSDACRNLMLQAQLFDHIANLMASPEMRGVEVIIVGDHPPPFFISSNIALYKTEMALYKTAEMKDGQVGWVHFRVKD